MTEGRAIVTGASRGIGSAIAIELDKRGYEVFGLSRSGVSPVGIGLVCDMTDEQAIKTVFDRITQQGTVSVLVNNAGYHAVSRASSLTTDEYNAVMSLNAAAVMIACREIYPTMKSAGVGLIINLGSFFDKLGVSGHLAYCASKAAVGAITRCLSVEWAAAGIYVVDIAPGYIETDLNAEYLSQPENRAWLLQRIPIRRTGTTTEVARAVGAVIDGGGALFTGQTIYLDGGQSINQ